jgi:hypothetical protein
MVKAYLRYEHAGAFGVISSGCNVLYDASGKQLFTGALENIAAWNIRQGSQVGATVKKHLGQAVGRPHPAAALSYSLNRTLTLAPAPQQCPEQPAD